MKRIAKFSKIITAASSFFLMTLVATSTVLAQNGVTVNLKPTGNFAGLENFTVSGIIAAAIQLILVVAALVALVFLILGGIRWITSGGDKEKTAKAQSTITAAVVGLLIIFATWAIIRLVESFFGIKIIGQLDVAPIANQPY